MKYAMLFAVFALFVVCAFAEDGGRKIIILPPKHKQYHKPQYHYVPIMVPHYEHHHYDSHYGGGEHYGGGHYGGEHYDGYGHGGYGHGMSADEGQGGGFDMSGIMSSVLGSQGRK